MQENNYYNQRMQMLGITEEHNTIKLLKYDTTTQQNTLIEYPIFKPHEQGIEIIVYNLSREQPTYKPGEEVIDNRGHGHIKGSRFKQHWSIIRLEKPLVKENGDTMKYKLPKGQGSYPFFPPALVEKYERKEPIKALYLTEGFFKSFKGSMAGLDIIGLVSITHMKDKATDTLHPDILELIKVCKVQRVVYLVDGDCNDLSSKAAKDPETDLFKRPQNFYISVNTFKRLLDDTEADKYFMYVNTDGILSELKPADRSQVKGLDDIMCLYPDQVPEMIEDINSVSKPGFWFIKYNITTGLSKVRAFFLLHDINQFYLYHAERTPELIKSKEFVFNGTKYVYNEETGKVEIRIPAEALKYLRVGDNFYKHVDKPNKYKQIEKSIEPRLKSTIVDDHGKDFMKHVPKYEGFCNIPDHFNYQPVYWNHFNIYAELDYRPAEEECTPEDFPFIYGFLKHIFGEQKIPFTHPKTREKKEYTNLQLGLDYIQILYQKPAEKLPILCLVSKENNTGKSTFGKLLKIIFGGNCAIVGNQDLAGDFNKHWATRTIVICDETKIDKQAVVEKVKSLSTTDKIMMNSKGKDHIEIDCFLKFIFITNNEDNFISVTDDDIRYWVIKVPVITEENPGLLENMVEEIPAFLAYLTKRKLATEKLNRMWFYPSLLRTKALEKLVARSRPVVVRELTQMLRDMFLDFGLQTIYMSRQDIAHYIFKGRYENSYLEQVLKEDMKIDVYHKFVDDQNEAGEPIKRKVYLTKKYSFPRLETRQKSNDQTELVRVDINATGRPYVFYREQFLSPQEIASLEISEETQYINSMTVQPKDDLPFK